LSFRVLLAEDEALLSLLIKETLTDLGCSVVGPVTSVAASIAVLDIEHIDLALIDLALSGELGLPVADALADKGIPFAFVTAYGSEMLRGTRHAEAPVLSKPFSLVALTNLVRQIAGYTAPFASARER
jgi:CheY-like chemotaxis protein